MSLPSNSENQINIKITIIGNPGVGKTCIINRYTKNEYKEGAQSTIGASYQQKIITKGEKTILLDIWDTAGQEKYYSLCKKNLVY